MSCFRIPKSILDAVEKECSNFWWGKVNGRKQLETWKSLCKPKSLGRMGFRQLESFNKALLTKQIWEIIPNLESLEARFLKARYFKHQDIMDANIGNNSSFIWRSIIWSRQLIVKGISWRVGNKKRDSDILG
ncbi:uncharacterized mitochondrial protein AtMg00310-like [Primulina huaijiensis]|uniref:uncharacterized mitochondrial protein AtMg00310-like n=1 Tax=Primulina huaijiensis TaxID=1492673 RepID=UPI003CC71F1F